jgi:prolyl 4-hydroxylase
MASEGPASQVQELVTAGQFPEAAETLIAAAGNGDAEATYMLAGWRISGQVIARDTASARELMGIAARAGHPMASLYHAYFLANGTGGPADWTAARAALAKIAASQADAADQLQPVSRSPQVYSAAAFLTDEECDYLVRAAEPRLQPSVVIERATGRSLPHPDRRSDGAFFGVGHEDLVVNAINRRIAAATATTTEQAEPLQILRYGPGGEFRPHFDFVKEGGNQRILTALIYLTDDYQGGETRLIRAGVDFRGRRGDLLLLHNVTADGRPDASSEHAGLPVLAGTKIVASRWIWREPYQVPPPQPIVAGM